MFVRLRRGLLLHQVAAATASVENIYASLTYNITDMLKSFLAVGKNASAGQSVI